MAELIVITRLKERMDQYGLTLAIAESLTAGQIQAAIGRLSGVSSFFEGGITTYSLKQKITQLGVDAQHVYEVNGVSARIAIEMAKGVALKFGCTLGISTTGYAEPSPEHHVVTPYAHIAVWHQPAMEEGEVVAQVYVEGAGLDRIQMQEHVTSIAIQTLLSYIETSG